MLLQIVVCCVQFVRYVKNTPACLIFQAGPPDDENVSSIGEECRAGMERVFEPVALCSFATASSDSPAARQIFTNKKGAFC